jgi:hypothetical protein
MYNTSVVKNYKATDSIARFHYIFFPDWKIRSALLQRWRCMQL